MAPENLPATGGAVPYDASAKQKAQAKTARIPIKIVPAETLKKPDWIRVKAGSPTTRFYEIKQILREHKLHTVCEEASCPNIGECFGQGTATFMIMGDKCTRRCPFCDVGHGRPDPLDADEPMNLARTIAALGIKVSRHCAYHGVAFNVAMDLRPFARIDPCGYAGLETVDLATLGVTSDWDTAAGRLGDKLASYLSP